MLSRAGPGVAERDSTCAYTALKIVPPPGRPAHPGAPQPAGRAALGAEALILLLYQSDASLSFRSIVTATGLEEKLVSLESLASSTAESVTKLSASVEELTKMMTAMVMMTEWYQHR